MDAKIKKSMRWIISLGFLLLAVPAQSQPAHSQGGLPHPWQPESREIVGERFPPPPGFSHLPAPRGSFAEWLRTLPLKPPGTDVRHFDTTIKPRKVHAAVIDLDVGGRDLQQCADAVMRLRAEFLFAGGEECTEGIAFNYTSGDRAAWSAWAAGERPRVNGNKVHWSKRAVPDDSYSNFRRYLDSVFTYAGSHSLSKELKKVPDPSKIEPGDVFIQGGFPGHAVIVLDVAANAQGHRRFLLAQSYMPAQDVHILLQPGSKSPWYEAQSGGALTTPEWPFRHSDLHRFPPASCGPHTAAEPLEVSGDMVPPKRIHPRKVDHYRQSGCTITQTQFYVLKAIIDTQGQVESMEFLKGPEDHCFADYLRRTVPTWRFEPALLEGQPVRVNYHLSATSHYR